MSPQKPRLGSEGCLLCGRLVHILTHALSRSVELELFCRNGCARGNKTKMCAGEWFATLGLWTACICVRSPAQRKQRTLSKTPFFQNWDILGQMGDWFVFRKLVKYLLYLNVGSLRNDNYGDGGNTKYASFFCLFSEFEFLSSPLPLH